MVAPYPIIATVAKAYADDAVKNPGCVTASAMVVMSNDFAVYTVYNNFDAVTVKIARVSRQRTQPYNYVRIQHRFVDIRETK